MAHEEDTETIIIDPWADWLAAEPLEVTPEGVPDHAWGAWLARGLTRYSGAEEWADRLGAAGVQCAACGLSYVPSVIEDVHAHEARHRRLGLPHDDTDRG